MARTLFQALSEVQRFDDLEDLLDFACEAIVGQGEWRRAFLSLYLGDEAAYGASGCEPDTKERFHRSFLRTRPESREARRQRILEHAWRGTSICFLPEGDGPRLSDAFIPSPDRGRSWRPADRLLILLRDWRGEILGVLSLDDPDSGDRPDDAALERLLEVESFVGLIGKLAENRFWSVRLERARRRFERAAACARHWVWEIDAEGRLLYSSPAVEDLLGHRPGEVQGRPLEALLVEGDRAAFRAWRDRPGGASLVSRCVHRDGSEVVVESRGTASPVSASEPAALLGTSQDISHRIRVEQALRASEATYRGIFEAATDAFLIFDHEGTIVEANPAACRMHGYPYEELIGLPGLVLVHPDFHARFEEFRRETKAGGRFHAEAVDVRRDGTFFDIEVYGTSFAFRGRPHLLAVVRDVTQRRQLAESLLRQQKDESIATLAGGVAHDFNNGLVGILGSADLLRRRLPEGDPLRAHCDRILRAGESLSALTEQLLAYAQGGRYRPEAVPLDRVLQETLSLVHGLQRGDIRIEAALPEDLWPIEADRTQLQQVLMNLVLNAFDAMEAGGILRIDAANERRTRDWTCPRTGPRPAGDYVWLRISDTGQGMSEETLARLFEPFYTTKFQGRGLGLAALLGILRNHGGSIEVESAPGCGASFHVRLPRSGARAAPASAERTAAEAPVREEPPLVLVVDDEEIVRDIASAMLASVGWRCVVAKDGEEAIARFRERRGEIDLVLLDVQMPGLSGAAVHRALMEIEPGVRVVLTSGYHEELAREGFDDPAGIAGFLPKPYTLEELSTRLRDALKARRNSLVRPG